MISRSLYPTGLKPQAGDIVAGCIHRPNPARCHFYYVSPPVEMERLDGRSERASWVLLCDACHATYVDEPHRATLDCAGIWSDDFGRPS